MWQHQEGPESAMIKHLIKIKHGMKARFALQQSFMQLLVHQSLGCKHVHVCSMNDVTPHNVNACFLKHMGSDLGLSYNKNFSVCHGCTKCSAFIETK